MKNFIKHSALAEASGMLLRNISKSTKKTVVKNLPGKAFKPKPNPQMQEYKKAIRAPWPQPNPHAPEQLAKSVLHLPSNELNNFMKITVGRLKRTLLTRSGPALFKAIRQRDIPAISDSELTEYLTETLFSIAMRTDLDATDRELMAPYQADDTTLYKLNFMPAGMVDALPGTYTAGCIAYFSRASEEQRCTPLGIVFPKDGETPQLICTDDGNSWELAKHYALNSASYCGLFGTHPLVHFPSDAINALTKSILPKDHILSKLLMPHLYIQLCLNFSVMFINKSPLHNNQNDFFTGFTNKGKDSALNITKKVYCGIDGNDTYSGYSFPREVQKTHSDYGDFIEGYYNIIRGFVAEVLTDVTLKDPHVERWVRECSHHVRDFPTVEELQSKARFIDTVAYIICNVSVIHSVDHYSFGQIPAEKLSLRLRQAPPVSRNLETLNRSKLTTVEDRFRMSLTHEMHITPSTETRLSEVDYGFECDNLQAATQRFHQQLNEYDQDPGVKRHAPLNEIACSIQY